jgi:hypothetical protein
VGDIMDEASTGGGPMIAALSRWGNAGVQENDVLKRLRDVLHDARTMEEFACGASLVFQH